MATKPENEAAKDVEDDFEVLQTFGNMADSTMSNASTIPEKQTFESQEKLSKSSGVSSINEKPKHSDTSSSLGEKPNTDSFSSLGDSKINVLPYYESSQFIERQLEKERKLGVLGEGGGREKGDEMCGEKGGSASGSGKGEECKGEGVNVGVGSVGEKGDQMCSDQGGFHIEGGEGGVERGKAGGKGVKMRRDVVSGSGEGGKVQDSNDGGVGDCSQANQARQPRQDPNTPYQDPPRLPRQDEQQAPNELQNPPDPQRNQPIVHNPRASCCSRLFLFAVVGVLCSVGFVFIRPHIPTMIFWLTKGSLPKPIIEIKDSVPKPIIEIKDSLPKPIIEIKGSLPKPIIEIKTKTHVSPSASSLELVAECKAYNTSYTIQHCQWRQIHPLPTSPENTVLPGGTKDCPPTTSINHPPTHNVDATLQGLKVPTDLGTYTFELACGHETGNSATKRVEIWVNELNPPIISVDKFKVVVSTSTGTAKLNVSCRAVQGKIVEKKWQYIDGPPELGYVTPSENGVVQLSQPGVYKFKYRCTDNFGGTALR